MKLTVLGCGDAFASKGRYNTSFLLTGESGKVMVDCGASSLIRLKQLHFSVADIHTIVITHFHGDHYGGLPFLMISKKFETNGREPLTIIGPEGIREKAINLQDALYPGTAEIPDQLNVKFLEYHEKEWLTHQGMRIYPRKVTHAPPSNPHGIRLEWENKHFAFSGDTEWDNSLIDLARDTDLFLVECNNFESESPGHLSYATLLEKRPQLKARKIYLTHMGAQVINERGIQFERLVDGMEIDF